jgi:8-oxo-dGTP diphosphatase
VRPSAYAVVADASGGGGAGERLAVVRTPLGVFLPGGGMDPGETPEGAAVREVAEECGLVVRVAGGWRAAAVQYVWSAKYRAYFEKRSTFLGAELDGAETPRAEHDHELLWLPPAKAAAMAHESHAWAVARWLAARR